MRVVVSLTTVPGRESLVARTLASIANQTRPADAIYLWIPRGKPVETGAPLNGPTVTVRLTDDVGPATKLIPVLDFETDPDTAIITVDDDVEYPDSLIEKLLTAASLFPECAIGFTGWAMVQTEPDPKVKHFNDSFSDCGVFQAVHVIEGTRGTLYKRRFFESDVLFHLTNLAAFRYHDDIFFGGYLASRGVTRLVRWFSADGRGSESSWHIACQDSGLHTTPNWYSLGVECWKYWTRKLAPQRIAEILPSKSADRLQLNADFNERQGYSHHFNRSGQFMGATDVTADLSSVPWPWPNRRFKEVLATNDVPANKEIGAWLGECLRITSRPGVIRLILGPPREVAGSGYQFEAQSSRLADLEFTAFWRCVRGGPLQVPPMLSNAHVAVEVDAVRASMTLTLPR